MDVFTDIRLNTNEPVYLQLAAHLKRKILRGEAVDGAPLPSRRELAGLLGINPNTAQKAFKLMEEEGFVLTPRNAASAVRVTPEIRLAIEEELTVDFVARFVKEAKENHLSYKRVIQLVSDQWEDDV